MRKLALLLLLLAPAVYAQTTIVTGTIVDPNGNPYANGTASAIRVVSAGQPVPPPVNVATNSVGNFSMALPSGFSYTFTICAPPVPLGPTGNPTPKQVCFGNTAPISVTGGSVDVSSALNAIAPILGPVLGSGGGAGTVTSAGVNGNTSPLFNVTVSTPTTTPLFNFSLLNAPPGTIFGNSTGSLGLPFYDTLSNFGIPGLGLINNFTNTNNYSGLVTLNGEGNAGNVAIKAANPGPIEYVASWGNDSNDGKSWGTAKLYVMSGYDALPSTGGIVDICSQFTGTIVNWTPGGQGAWIMGPADPNYGSPPAGWRKLKSVKFIGACPDFGGFDEPVNYVGNNLSGPAIWISSTTGQGARLDFENLLLQYQNTNVQLGVDSNGAQTTNSGVWAITFRNITSNVPQQAGAGPGWLIGGGDTFNVYMDKIQASGNGTATPGSDQQAAILFKPGGGANKSANGVITNSIVIGGGIKYYEGNITGLMTVRDTYSESINGGSFPGGVATFWATSTSITTYNIQNVIAADAVGNVCPTRFDGETGKPVIEGNITVTEATGVCGNNVQQGAIISDNLGSRVSAIGDPLTQGLNGVSAGRNYGFYGNTQRQFSASMIRYQNLAPSTSSSWTISGSGGSIATGIAAPDGSTGAARVTSTTNNVTVTFYSQSVSLTVGQYFVAGLYTRFNSPDDYYDFSGSNTYGLGINIGGTGNTATCSTLYPPGMKTDGWFWVYQICQVTAAPNSPATVSVISAAPVVGAHTSVVDFYAPMLLNIPAGAISNDEAYELANNLVPYNSTCAVGTLCGILGSATPTGTVTTLSVGNLSPLFTSLVTNPTTTPFVAYTLSNAAGNTVFGNCTGSSAAPSFCSLTEPMLPAATVFTDQNATFGAHTYDFSGATLMKARVGAGLTTTVNGDFGYDSVAGNWQFWNGTNLTMPLLAAGFVSGDCGQPTKSGNQWTIADSGNPCGTGSGGAFSSLTGGTNTGAAMICGTGCSLTRSGAGVIDANKISGLTPATSATTDTTNANNVISGHIASSVGGTGIDTSASTGVAQVSAGTWSVSTALANGTTCTTQTALSNDTKCATDAYADAAVAAGITALNPMTTIGDRIGGAASGTPARVAGGLTGQVDTAVNGATGGFSSPGVAGRTVSTSTGDTILCDDLSVGKTLRDRGTTIWYTSASGEIVTLPQAGSTGCSSNFVVSLFQTGAGTQTITPTTSQINGQATLAMTQNSWCTPSGIDNTNYIARCATWLRFGAGLTPTYNADGSTTAALATALPNGTTATTQSAGDSTVKVASDQFVHTEIANAIAGVNPAVAVQAATAAVLPNSPTYNNGVSGIGATLTTATLNATLVVDGYTPLLNDRILVKNQASAFQNGVYTVTQLAGVGLAWVLTRALDYDQPSDMNNTGAIPVVNGTVNTATTWVQTSTVNTVGTDAVTFTRFSINPAAIHMYMTADGSGAGENNGIPATLYAFNYVVLTSAITVTRVGVQVLQTPAGCSTASQFGIYDNGTPNTSSVVTLANGSGTADSGAISINVSAGHALQLGVVRAESGCATTATFAVETIEYVQQ